MHNIVELLEKRWAPTVKVGNITITALLYADNMELVAKTARELQFLIDLMAEYLESKKLRLNLGKTEIMIFNQEGRRNLVENEKFRFEGQENKVVEKEKYMGFTLTPICSWKEHVSEMSKRGKAAVGAVLRNDLVKKSKSLKMFKQIFDSKIKPAIHYGAELWGLEAAENLESVQFRNYKRLFGLHQTTHNQLIKGDFGIFSLKLHRLYQVFKFWLILAQLPEDRLAI